MKKKSKIKIFYVLIVFVIFVLVILFFVFGRLHKNLSTLNQNIIQELKLSAREKQISLQGISISADNDLIAWSGNVKILFNTEKDIEKQTQALQKILKGTKIKKTISVIDFRFNKIVVR